MNLIVPSHRSNVVRDHELAEIPHPHKDMASMTRPGRLDFVTHRGDHVFNRGGHYEHRTKNPYTKKRM